MQRSLFQVVPISMLAKRAERCGTSHQHLTAPWQLKLGLFSSMAQAKVEANAISHKAAINACEKGQEWQLALGLISNMAQTKVEAAAISACEKGKTRVAARDGDHGYRNSPGIKGSKVCSKLHAV